MAKVNSGLPPATRQVGELVGDYHLRLMLEATEWAAMSPCQLRHGTTCPCAPCKARRVLKELKSIAARMPHKPEKRRK